MSTTDSSDAATAREAATATPVHGIPHQPVATSSEYGARSPITPVARHDTRSQPTQIVVNAPDLSFLKAPALIGALTYAAMLVVAIVAGIVASSPLAGTGAIPEGISTRLPFFLVGMGMFGPLHAGASAAGGLASAYGQLTLVPLALTLIGLGATWFLTARLAPSAQTIKGRWRDSAIVGAALGILTAVVAAIVKITWAADFYLLSADAVVNVKPFEALVGAFAVGTLGAGLGNATTNWRIDLTALGIRIPAPFAHSIANVASGGLVAGTLASLVALVAGIIKIGFPATIGAFLTILPNALAFLFAFGGLGGIEVGGHIADGGPISLFTDGVPGVLWLSLVPIVLAVVIAAVRGLLAGGLRTSWRDAWVTPVVLAGATALALLLTTVSFSGSGDLGFIDERAGGGSIRITWVSVLIAATWGLLIEAAERYVAPLVVGLIPALPPLYARLTKQEPAVTGVNLPTAHGPGVPALDRRKAKALGLSILGAVVVIGGALVSRAVVQNVVFTPAKPVEQYIAAIQSGDVEAAFALADPDVPNAERALLTNEVYNDVEGHLSGGKVTNVEKDGKTAHVTVQSKQDGSTVTQYFSLTKQGKQLLVFDNWVLDAPSVPQADVTQYLPDDIDKFTVNGIEFSRGERFEMAFRALPGRYTVSLPAAPLLTSDDFTVLVSGDGESSVQGAPDGVLTYELTAEATAKGKQLGSDYAAECMAATTVTVEACFLDVYVGGDDPRDATWTLNEPVEVETFPSGGAGVVVHVMGEASVTGTYSQTDWWTDEVTNETFTRDGVGFGVWLTYEVDGDTWSLVSADEWEQPYGD